VADSFVGPMRSSAPVGSPTQYTDPKQIDAILKSSDPEAVAESGRSYQKFAAAYEKIAGELLGMRGDLYDAWSGEPAAAAAQSQLREVWSAAATVHQTAQTFGVTIERHGSEHLAWYKYSKPPSKDLPEAQSWMTGANERVTQAWGSLPQDMSTSLPPGGMPVEQHAPASAPPATGVSSLEPGSESSHQSRLASSSSASAGSSLPGAPHGSVTSGSGTQLAGLPTAAPGGDTSVLPGGGTSLLPGAGTGLAPGSVPPGAGLSGPTMPEVIGAGPAGGYPSTQPRSPGTPGNPSSGAAASEAESSAAARRGLTGPVVGGGGGRETERERARGSWLAEDEDIWTGDIRAAPRVIGEEERAVEAAEPAEAPAPIEVEIDLTGDDVSLEDVLGKLAENSARDPAMEIAELKARLERLERQARSKPGVVDGESDWIGGGDV
jgi:hypothetical protein